MGKGTVPSWSTFQQDCIDHLPLLIPPSGEVFLVCRLRHAQDFSGGGLPEIRTWKQLHLKNKFPVRYIAKELDRYRRGSGTFWSGMFTCFWELHKLHADTFDILEPQYTRPHWVYTQEYEYAISYICNIHTSKGNCFVTIHQNILGLVYKTGHKHR